MTRNKVTALLCMLAGFITFVAAYTAFVCGFNYYTAQLPQYDGKTAVGAVSASQLHVSSNNTMQQSYNDAAYFLQPSVNVQGTYNDIR